MAEKGREELPSFSKGSVASKVTIYAQYIQCSIFVSVQYDALLQTTTNYSQVLKCKINMVSRM